MKTSDYEKLSSPSRTRTSVAISGLDRSTPDDMVKDGACEELHNLRYKDNAWRPVSEIASKHRLLAENADEFEIVYHHPAAGENVYIARYKDEPETFATITFHEDEPETISAFATIKKTVAISHFGNILIFDVGSSLVYYMLRDSEYHKVTFPPYARLSISNYNNTSPEPTTFWAEYSDPVRIESYPYSLAKVGEVINNGGKILTYETDIANFTTGVSLLPVDGEYAWRGELLLFSTWQLEDGTNVAPSPLLLVHSSITPRVKSDESHYVTVATDDNSGDKILRLANNRAKSTSDFTYRTDLLSTIAPTLEIRISNNWDYSNVKKLVIWATRIHPTFEGSLPTDPIEYQKALERFWFADNNLAEQNFYKYTELEVSAFADDPENENPNYPETPDHDPEDGYVDDEYDPSEGWNPEFDDRDDGYDDWGAYALSTRNTSGNLLYTLTLSRRSLEGIVNNTRYTPNNNAHLLFATRPYDYNNRFHYFDYKQVLAKGYHISDSENPWDNGELQSFKEWVELEVDNKAYNVVSESSKHGYSILEGTPLHDVISYPDVRAKQYAVEGHFKVALTPAYGNGLAWYVEKPTKFAKFPPITLDSNISIDPPADNSIIRCNNKIQVTSSNNLFSLPFDNNYVVGSRENRIIALQSAAIEMSDAKFGEFPLFAFTEEGIFALQAGSGTLYASIIPINYDKIINPNTLAINGGIIYITERGVHLLSARGDKLTSEASTLISSPIHGKDGRPPLDFLRTCQIMWPKEHNEVIFHNPDNGEEIAYVFNLDAGYWSTRSLKGTKINTDEMVDSNTIYDLTHEDVSKTLAGAISTRPIKLGNVEFKRADTIIPRLNTGNTSSILAFYALGSVDGSKFHPLRKCTLQLEPNKVNPIVIRRTPFSAKYFKFIFGLDHSRGVPYSTAITHIDMEWYTKFQRRMR